MAQSAITVTPPNPTPPTNMSFTGTTAPNPPNYSKNLYTDWLDNTTINTPANNPFYDDGAAGTVTLFAANLAALTQGVGSGATAGGTENSYPGTGTDPDDTTSVQDVGAVPAATSVAHEGAGTEVVVTAPGSVATAPTASFSCLGSYTNTPNASHASSLSPLTNPTLTSATPTTASGAGNATVTATGVGFTRQSVIHVNGIAYPTTYVSSTSLTASAPKKATAGTLPVTVVTGGAVTTAAQNWTFT